MKEESKRMIALLAEDIARVLRRDAARSARVGIMARDILKAMEVEGVQIGDGMAAFAVALHAFHTFQRADTPIEETVGLIAALVTRQDEITKAALVQCDDPDCPLHGKRHLH